ncbi:MAG: lipocalin-like domain-containing protein [Muribaculaceae bacterium]|nr:lipocalin-like domain-containing protein [Muribaculaceae bacterium]
MKRIISKYTIRFIGFLVLLLTTGCPKHPINGDLDGQWQVMDVVPEAPEIILQERLYMCFSLHVCQLTEYGNGVNTVGNMKYVKDKTLYLDFPNAHSALSKARLKQYGIYSNPVTFTIEHLDKKKLILRDGDVVVTLRKF